MGNFSRNTFDKLKHYVGVRLQQGVPLVDADWNEQEDIRKYEFQKFLKWFIGNGVPAGNNGFQILEAAGTMNDFYIGGGDGTPEGEGRCIVEGLDVMINEPTRYSAQPLYNNPDLASKWEVDPIDPLSEPTSERMDTVVYLDVWEREVDSTEDSDIVNPAIGIETSVRLKREWAVRVEEGTSTTPPLPMPPPTAGHFFYKLATLTRPGGSKVISSDQIADERTSVVNLADLAAFAEEIEDARGMKANLGNRLDESLTKGGQLRHNVVGIDQLDTSVENKLIDVNRIHKVPLLHQTIFSRGVEVSVGKNPHGIAFDGTHIWVTNSGNNTVSKIDISDNSVDEPVRVEKNPHGIAFDGTHIWVTNSGNNTVSKIDISNNSVDEPVRVGQNPHGIAFDGTHIWVANSGDDYVSKIDITSNTVVARVTVGTRSSGIAFDGTHIWVANSGNDYVSKIDITSNTVVARVSVGKFLSGIAFDGTHIWVTKFDGGVGKVRKIKKTI